MAEDVIQLFEEYAAQFARGERPDVREFLARAGERADVLADLIDDFLREAVPLQPREEEVEMVRAWLQGEPTLLGLRRQRRLTREAVVEALLARLGLAEGRRAKLADYYHRLESGLLDLARVDRRVLDALAGLFGVSRADLLVWPGTVASEGAFYRAVGEPPAALLAELPLPPEAEPTGWDEVDELFLGPRREDG